MKNSILHITWSMAIGGAERALYQLIRGQREQGIDADLLVASKVGYYGERVQETGARVIGLGQRRARDLSVLRRFREAIAPYGILHFQAASPLLMQLASLSRRPVLCYTHRGGDHRFRWERLLMYKICGFYLRRYFQGLSGNTEHAARIASRLFHIPRERVETTYNGIDFLLLEPVVPRDVLLRKLGETEKNWIRVGTSGNLRDWKRVDYLIRAMVDLKDLPVHCYIVGDGPARGHLEALSMRLGLGEMVTFTGKTDRIGDYLQMFDVFVLPSDACESFGNSAVEAMAMGIPTIIMADGGGLLEHIREGCGFVADDVPTMTRQIRELASSAELRARVGARGRRYVRNKYTIENMVEAYARLYDSALGVKCAGGQASAVQRCAPRGSKSNAETKVGCRPFGVP